MSSKLAKFPVTIKIIYFVLVLRSSLNKEQHKIINGQQQNEKLSSKINKYADINKNINTMLREEQEKNEKYKVINNFLRFSCNVPTEGGGSMCVHSL